MTGQLLKTSLAYIATVVYVQIFEYPAIARNQKRKCAVGTTVRLLPALTADLISAKKL